MQPNSATDEHDQESSHDRYKPAACPSFRSLSGPPSLAVKATPRTGRFQAVLSKPVPKLILFARCCACHLPTPILIGSPGYCEAPSSSVQSPFGLRCAKAHGFPHVLEGEIGVVEEPQAFAISAAETLQRIGHL